MARKDSNLKIVEHQTEAELQAKYEREKAARRRDEEEDSWRLTRPDITALVRALRAQLEDYRYQLEAMTFDIIAVDTPPSIERGQDAYPGQLAEAFNPSLKGHYKRLSEALPSDDRLLHDDLSNLSLETAETSFHIGVLAGAVFTGASDREIDRLERSDSRHCLAALAL
jgi:hypothetical protein